MPDRGTNSVRSFLSGLHFSGKVIMASILFGFGLLLVGAILLVIATGGQKTPPREDEVSAKRSPMAFVGPGVMGVGAFFIIVGTIMCLIETRILRRRKHTDHDSLINAEVVPTTGNALPPSTEFRDHAHREGDKNQDEIEETEVKTLHAPYPIRNPEESAEKFPTQKGSSEKNTEEDLSTSVEREQTSVFNTSVYVDAVAEHGDDDEDEQQFVTESSQFSTPPEGKPEEILKAPFDGKEDDLSKISDSAPAEADLISEQPDQNFLLPLTEGAGSPLPLANDSKPTAITAAAISSANGLDLTKGTLHPVRDAPDGPEIATVDNNNIAAENKQITTT